MALASVGDQKRHLRWTMSGPFSSYSSLEIHMEGIVGRDPRMEPPSHAACLRSGRASTCIHRVAGWVTSVLQPKMHRGAGLANTG